MDGSSTFSKRLVLMLGLACFLIIGTVTFFHYTIGNTLTQSHIISFDLRLKEISHKIDYLRRQNSQDGEKTDKAAELNILDQLKSIESLLLDMKSKQGSFETKLTSQVEKVAKSQSVSPGEGSEGVSLDSIDFDSYSQLIADVQDLSDQGRKFNMFQRNTIGKILMLQEKAASVLPQYEIPASGSVFLGGGLREGEALPDWRRREDGTEKKFAYVTLIGGVKKDSNGHLGFLVNTAATAWSLKKRKSIGEVVAMIDFADDSTSLPKEQEELLQRYGVKIQYLEPWGSYQSNFVTVEFQKMKIWLMEEYDVVIFFDGDLMIHGTLDPYFATSHDLFVRGRSEPINAGLMVVHPDTSFFQEKIFPWIEWRLDHVMSADKGWGDKFPISGFPIRRGWTKGDWHSMVSGPAVQGLLYLLYEIENKPHSLIDVNKITYWDEAGKTHPGDNRVALDPSLVLLASTVGDDPITTQFYSHFTSKKKPWMATRPFPDPNVEKAEGWRIDWWAWRCEQIGVSFEELRTMQIRQIGFFANHKMVRKQQTR